MPYVPASGPEFVHYGPGKLYIASTLTEVEPTDLTTAWGAGWIKAGYTDAGHTFTYTPSYENIEVAETLLPIAKVPTAQDATLEFAFAEITARNFQIALNGATITASGTGSTAIDKVEPLAFGVTETRVKIGWEADDASERWVYRRCLQTGAVAVARQRGAAKATIPVNFSLETPSGGARPWMKILKSTATIT